MDAQQEAALEQESPMFVQTARGASSAGGVLTLHGITPSTLYFSDRPQRIVGHLTSAQFVDLWGQGENSFAEDPPNAVLSFLEPGDEAPEDAVIVIKQPVLGTETLAYAFDVLEGTVPTATGPVTLFIDPFGRPLSPVSGAGMNRRDRRRDRRRI
jgi:hypothetical protein